MGQQPASETTGAEVRRYLGLVRVRSRRRGVEFWTVLAVLPLFVLGARFGLGLAPLAALGAGPVGFKLALGLADFGVVLALDRLLRATGRPRDRVILYAWNPLAVMETAGSGHVEPVGVLLVLLAGGWLAASQTVGSFVAELSESAPRYWATGTAAPCLSVFRPVSVSERHDVGTPSGQRDDSLWWTFEAIHRALLGADAAMLSEYLSDRDRVQAQLLESDEAEAWQIADRWLHGWRQRLSDRTAADERPRWLRRYWRRADERASRDSRLPWRSP